MKNYKLYKVTVEKVFVVAAPVEQSVDTVESSITNIMHIHADSMRSEDPTHILAEEIHCLSNIPPGWEDSCLPYANYPYSRIPEDLLNKSIKELL